MTIKTKIMRNSLKKYEIENLGSFITLDDKDFNDLFTLELNLLQPPAVLYISRDYDYTGGEIVISHKELKSILQSLASQSLN
jgi:hypothetical protein